MKQKEREIERGKEKAANWKDLEGRKYRKEEGERENEKESWRERDRKNEKNTESLRDVKGRKDEGREIEREER